MTSAPATTWLVAALAPADRVLLLGPGWDEVADALAHQGVEVLRDPDAAGDVAVVGVALGVADALSAGLDASPRQVITRLDLDGTADVAACARPWPLVNRTEACLDTTWVASWDVAGDAGPDLAGRLAGALHATALGLRALADAAVEDRESASRALSVATRRQGAAESRARVTSTLADRWAASQDALVASLHARADDAATASPAGVSAATTGLRSLFRRSGASDEPADDGQLPRARAASPTGWRVAVLPGAASQWLRGWVGATEVAPGSVAPDELVDHVGGHLDVLVIGRTDLADRAAVMALVDAAREAEAFVVGVADGGMPWPRFEDLCDVVLSDAPDRSRVRTLVAPPPVDPTVVNPTVGFRWKGSGLVTVCTGEGVDLAEVTSAIRAMGAETELVGPGTDTPLPPDLRDRARKLSRSAGVIDVPAAHATVADHARTLAGLAVAGVPIVAPALPDAVRAMLGPVLADAVVAARTEDLEDPHTREAMSVRQRRAALWTHTTEARWRRLGRALDLAVPSRPSVSAVVVTNRPTHLEHCADQLSRQTYRPLEVVLGLHGTRFTVPQVDAFVDRVGVPVTGVAIDGHRTLGEGLTIACQAASGDVITKWDDDDHYGPDHVVDLVQALDYSGATIVGKGAEFVHLAQLDITIRRMVGAAESGSRSVAGGTLALRREHLAEAGWWRRIPRGVDQRLLDDVERAGGRLHRTHGYGFVLERRSAGHTWSIDVDYFLRHAERQWRGLAREIAALDDSVLIRGAGRAPGEA